jgi:hypothetical protein
VHHSKLGCSTSGLGQSRRLSDVGMSASPPIVLQNYFELPSEEIFFKIAHRCGILIQETARSDSILARFRLIHCSRASFATQSPGKQTFSSPCCTAGSSQPSLDLVVYKQTTILEMWQRPPKNRHIFARPAPIAFVCLVMKMIVSEGWRHEYSETAWAAAE